jgi:hypothetical protein
MQRDGYATASDPLWGRFQTYLVDIDNQSHRRWLNHRYRLGDVMVSHQIVDDSTSEQIVHTPTI